MTHSVLKKYKILNVILFVLISVLLAYMYASYTKWFVGEGSYDFYKYYYAIYEPIYEGGKWLALILGILLFLPAHIFRRWLVYIAAPIILLTTYLVQEISVYSGNFLNPSRGQLAAYGMILLAIVTFIFVLITLLLSWKKRKI